MMSWIVAILPIVAARTNRVCSIRACFGKLLSCRNATGLAACDAIRVPPLHRRRRRLTAVLRHDEATVVVTATARTALSYRLVDGNRCVAWNLAFHLGRDFGRVAVHDGRSNVTVARARDWWRAGGCHEMSTNAVADARQRLGGVKPARCARRYLGARIEDCYALG